MAHGISAATRPRDQLISNPAATFGVTPRGHAVDREFHNTANGHAPNVVRFDRSGSIVGGGPKRWFDLAGALAALLLLMPLFCLIALAIKLWDRFLSPQPSRTQGHGIRLPQVSQHGHQRRRGVGAPSRCQQ
jgi:hypothetical protein